MCVNSVKYIHILEGYLLGSEPEDDFGTFFFSLVMLVGDLYQNTNG